MITIDAEFYPKVVSGYKSFAEAVNAGISSPSATRARDDSKLIEGQRVVEACWDAGRVGFLFSGGRYLLVYVRDGFPEWSIGGSACYPSLRNEMPSTNKDFLVRYVTASGESKGRQDSFSIDKILNKCIGRTVLRIAVRPTALSLQFRGTGWHVFFMPVKRHDNGEPLLVWVEDRD